MQKLTIFKSYFRQSNSKHSLIGYLILSPLEAVTSVLFAYLIEPMIQAATNHNLHSFILFAALIIFLGLANCIFSFYSAKTRLHIVKHFEESTRNSTFNKIMMQKPSFVISKNANEYVSMLDVDINELGDKYMDNLLGIYSVLCSFIASLCAVISLDWKIAIFVIVFSLFSVNIPKLFNKKLNNRMLTYSESAATLLVRLKDCFAGFSVLHTFKAKNDAIQRVKNTNKQLIESDIKKENTFNIIGTISLGFSQFTFIGVIIIGALMTCIGKYDVSAILALSQMIGGIIAPFEGLPTMIAGINSTDELYQKISVFDSSEETNVTDFSPTSSKLLLSFNNVSFSYDSNRTILSNFSYEFNLGKKYVILGESGSGKSTIAKLITKLYAPNSGTISLNGVNIDAISDSSYYDYFCYQEQSVHLFEDTLIYNIELGRKFSQNELEMAINSCLLTEVISNLDDGTQTIFNENGNNLSGGERQRIGLARCFIGKTSMMILDEVLANLDNSNSKKVEDQLMSFKNCGCILISHQLHLDTLKKCDEIILINSGKIEASGSYEELVQKGIKFEKYALLDGAASGNNS